MLVFWQHNVSHSHQSNFRAYFRAPPALELKMRHRTRGSDFWIVCSMCVGTPRIRVCMYVCRVYMYVYPGQEEEEGVPRVFDANFTSSRNFNGEFLICFCNCRCSSTSLPLWHTPKGLEVEGAVSFSDVKVKRSSAWKCLSKYDAWVLIY